MKVRETPLRLTFISDIHLGHLNTPTAHIIANLRTYFLPIIAETDVLMIGGDVFDSGRSLSDSSTNLIIAFLIDLMIECEKHGVIVRVVRGTFSHDRDQCAIFPTLHSNNRFTNSLRYFDAPTLEYIEEVDLKVVYLPDNLPYASSDAVLVMIHKQMADMGWDTVDYAVVHSYFDHHLPPGMPHRPKVCYRADQFGFVTRFVSCGHVHHGGQFENILTNGSFTRLAHGEEHDKGFFYVVDDGRDAKITHVLNQGAAVYATKDLCGIAGTESAVTEFLGWAKTFSDEWPINLRAIHPSPEVKAIIWRTMLKEFPHVRYRHKTPTNHEIEVSAEPPPLNTTHYVTPTPDTLPQLILDELVSKGREHPLTTDQIKTILDNL